MCVRIDGEIVMMLTLSHKRNSFSAIEITSSKHIRSRERLEGRIINKNIKRKYKRERRRKKLKETRGAEECDTH